MRWWLDSQWMKEEKVERSVGQLASSLDPLAGQRAPTLRLVSPETQCRNPRPNPTLFPKTVNQSQGAIKILTPPTKLAGPKTQPI